MAPASIKNILETMDYGPAPESEKHALAWLAEHGSKLGHFIGGAFVKPARNDYFESQDPARGRPLARLAQGSAEDIDRAVEAAGAAFAAWSMLPGDSRGRYLYAIARHIQKHARLLSVLESLDNGKPIRESRDIDIPLVARHFYHHAGWASLVETEYAGFRPVGVCAQIIPWNFPLLMLAWKIAPALAAGNTVVLKPAEYTSLTALAFAEICREVGLPSGVVNIVTGDGETGALLVDHPKVAKIAFTGSTEVGRRIRVATAGTGKKLSLELGGKSPFVVFEDADLDSAVEGLVDAIWFNQGQVCCAGSRLLVQEGVAERLHNKLRARMKSLRVGDPLDKSTDIGAIVAPVQLERVRRLVEQGCRDGATCWQPGTPLPEHGLFYPPTLLTEVEPASIVAREEIFGPVLVSMSFRTPDEAIQLANNTRYGLAASVWSEAIGLSMEVASRIQAGVVWINCTNQFDAASGFGGYRESGFGREGGREGLFEYLLRPWEKPQPEGTAEQPERRPALSPFPAADPQPAAGSSMPAIDRTAKLYVGGKQARPDSGYSFSVRDPSGRHIGEAAFGNRKDIRNAVEAAHKAKGWSEMTAHGRAQVIFYIAENLSARAKEFDGRLARATGAAARRAREEVELAIRRTFYYAAYADKFEGAVHATQSRNVTLAVNEPWGVMGIVCPDEAPLLAFVSLTMPALALGNRLVVVPSQLHPLLATDLYQVFDTSDLPDGAINIVTGDREELALVLAEHDDIAALWYVGSHAGSAAVERASAGNLKATWVNHGQSRRWASHDEGQGADYLRRATQVKNIWMPYGE